jgi:DNA-binding XRE family transcriptional regulator
VKLGDVLKKERHSKGLSPAQAASELGVSQEEYGKLEGGNHPAEEWGPLLARLAIKLSAPTSRLISETGKSADANRGECGRLIRVHREMKQKSVAELAAAVEIPQARYEEIERCESPIEDIGPLLLRFAEMVDQPIFNLFYPCGVPLEKLEDYP